MRCWMRYNEWRWISGRRPLKLWGSVKTRRLAHRNRGTWDTFHWLHARILSFYHCIVIILLPFFAVNHSSFQRCQLLSGFPVGRLVSKITLNFSIERRSMLVSKPSPNHYVDRSFSSIASVLSTDHLECMSLWSLDRSASTSYFDTNVLYTLHAFCLTNTITCILSFIYWLINK